MQVDNATNLDRKSGVPGDDDDLFPVLSLKGVAALTSPQSNGGGFARSISSHVRCGERGAPCVTQPATVTTEPNRKSLFLRLPQRTWA
jgi:hypothetical protein